jgi:hypothetical protein
MITTVIISWMSNLKEKWQRLFVCRNFVCSKLQSNRDISVPDLSAHNVILKMQTKSSKKIASMVATQNTMCNNVAQIQQRSRTESNEKIITKGRICSASCHALSAAAELSSDIAIT